MSAAIINPVMIRVESSCDASMMFFPILKNLLCMVVQGVNQHVQFAVQFLVLEPEAVRICIYVAYALLLYGYQTFVQGVSGIC